MEEKAIADAFKVFMPLSILWEDDLPTVSFSSNLPYHKVFEQIIAICSKNDYICHRCFKCQNFYEITVTKA